VTLLLQELFKLMFWPTLITVVDVCFCGCWMFCLSVDDV